MPEGAIDMTYVSTGCVIVVTAIAATSLLAAEPTKDTLETVRMSVAEEKARLVDVREKSEWDAGHVEGAVFLPLSELKSGITAEAIAKRIPKDQIIYTHCVAGVRSCTAADILVKHGYDVRPLKPGYKDLLAAGFKKAEK
jgi:rhodanese-related sulfurtransferase